MLRKRQAVITIFVVGAIVLGQHRALLTPIVQIGAVAAGNLFDSPGASFLALSPVPMGGVQIVDRRGELLYELAGPNGGWREPVALEEISPSLIQATLAAEDADFYTNPGVNVRGVARAVWENLAFWERGGFFRGSGGSSITQQVVKIRDAVPTGDRNPGRKVREMFTALALTQAHSKHDILQFYLNSLFYGNGAYGAEAAAQAYFGTAARELSLAQGAFLAGIPNAPAIFDAFDAFDLVRSRQQDILSLMVKNGFITADDAAAAFNQPIEFEPAPHSIEASHFGMYVHELLPQLVGDTAVRSGVRVTTTLDLALQHQAEQIVLEHLAGLEPRLGPVDAALVAIDPQSGEILAMVGGRSFDDPGDGQVNNALALNQPGSAFKPITYLAAFEKGWSPATIVDDSPMVLDGGRQPYVLQNFDGRFSGRLPVRQALGNSLNPPAVQALQFAGIEKVHQLAGRMGISTLDDPSSYGLAFTLGGADVTLLDLTFAYSVLANGGEQRGMSSIVTDSVVSPTLDPTPVLRVEDRAGRLLWAYEPRAMRITAPEHAYLITSILSDNSARTRTYGPNSPLNLTGRPAAVKTGLSDGPREAWTVGYTPQLVAGIWVGNKDNEALSGASSVQVATPIWNRFMEAALEGKPVLAFDVPNGVVTAQVCRSTGLPADRSCPQVITEVFAASQAPVIAAAGPQAGAAPKPVGPAAVAPNELRPPAPPVAEPRAPIIRGPVQGGGKGNAGGGGKAKGRR